jgi:hypothetical protein
MARVVRAYEYVGRAGRVGLGFVALVGGECPVVGLGGAAAEGTG